MGFETFGPFNLETAGGRRIPPAAKRHRDFWRQVDARETGLAGAYGCFLLSTLDGGRSIPWHVGIAFENPFSTECLSDSMVQVYERVSRRKSAATVLLHLIAWRSVGENPGFVRPPHASEFRHLESLLLSLCINRNEGLLNVCAQSVRRTASATSLLQAQLRPSIDHRAFRETLGLT